MLEARPTESKTPGRPAQKRQPAVLVTGAGGEMGHGLIRALAESSEQLSIVGLDLRPATDEIADCCSETLAGDVRDQSLLDGLARRYHFTQVYHLAALLSTSAEQAPIQAFEVNLGGTMNLLRLAIETRDQTGVTPQVLFPSTIAVYGVPTLEAKLAAGSVAEHECLEPRTMYGCNKLSAEQLGRYFTLHHRQLQPGEPGSVDFRAIRFPGIISADTIPTGGTTDYGPQMLHAAAQDKPYQCFVRPDSRLPFMTMPEAIEAMLSLAAAERSTLTRTAYNVRSFAPTAAELAETIGARFPALEVGFEPHPGRQMIVDGWPADVDDRAAAKDWGWSARHTLETALDEYLIPGLRRHYGRT